MNKDLSDELLNLIEEHTGIPKADLTDDKSLFHDFGVAGMDGGEILDEMVRRFGIDMSHVNADRLFR